MIGVVLWKDPAGHKAVVWCEDHANLAFMTGGHNNACPKYLDVGDMIRFDLRVENETRYVANPVLVRQQCCPDLPAALANTVVSMEQPAQSKRGPDRARQSAELIKLGAA